MLGFAPIAAGPLPLGFFPAVAEVQPPAATAVVASIGLLTGVVGMQMTGSAQPSTAVATVSSIGQLMGVVSLNALVAPPVVLVPGKRRVRVGDPTAPAKLQRLDVQDVDDVAFDYAAVLLPGESIASVVVTAEVLLGGDDSPASLLQFLPQIDGATVLQRVAGRVSGVTYMLRSVAALDSGRVLVGAALLPVFKLR